MATVTVMMPYHLRNLAKVTGDVQLEVAPPVTVRAILDALEQRFPTLLGTVRDQVSGARRPFLRFFVCQQDISFESVDVALPEAIASGAEPFMIVGAIAGGST